MIAAAYLRATKPFQPISSSRRGRIGERGQPRHQRRRLSDVTPIPRTVRGDLRLCVEAIENIISTLRDHGVEAEFASRNGTWTISSRPST